MRLLRILGVSAVIVALTSPAFAVCNPGKNMGQLSFDLGFQETRFPGANNDAYSGLIIGKFWAAGSFATNNSGTYPVSGPVMGNDDVNNTWIIPSSLVDPTLSGNMTWGYMGNANVVGCPGGQLITILQSPNTDGNGASTIVARVAEVPGPFMDFDYCKTSTNGWDGKQIPKPAVTSVKAGTGLFNLTVDPAAADVHTLFYGEAGMDPSATITGRRLYRFVGPGAVGQTRPQARTAWTDTGLAATGAVGGTPLALPQLDCSTLGAGNDLFLAWALVLDGGAYQSDLVGNYTQIVCNSGLAQPGKFKNIDKRQGPKPK